jgi:transposase
LRTGLVYESYVPTKEFREKRRDQTQMVRNRTMLENKVHSLLDKYDCKTDLRDIFGKSGMIWLKTLDVLHIDKVILNATLAAIENINLQIDTISKELAGYAWDSEDVKIPLSMDIFSALLIATEIVDVRRFSSPWKLVSYARIIWKNKEGKNNKTRLSLVKWKLVQCAMTAVRYDKRLGTFYERLKRRKGSAKYLRPRRFLL